MTAARPRLAQLLAHGLLRDDWRKPNFESLDFKDGNATPAGNLVRKALAGLFVVPSFGLKTAEIPAGSLKKMHDGRGGFEFLGNRGPKQGIHRYWSLFYRIDKQEYSISKASANEGLTIQNGDKWIVVVPQGFVGLALDMGQPVLLPPGMHRAPGSGLSHSIRAQM